MNYLSKLLEFIIDHKAEILDQTGEHIGLTAIALTIAVFSGLPIGILLTRYKKISPSLT